MYVRKNMYMSTYVHYFCKLFVCYMNDDVRNSVPCCSWICFPLLLQGMGFGKGWNDSASGNNEDTCSQAFLYC